MLQVREALIPRELPVLRQLLQEYADGLGIDLCFQRFAQELAELPGQHSPPLGGLWVAAIDHEIAGCVALRPLGMHACELKRLYVRPAFRKNGVGRMLATRVLTEAARSGYATLYLDTLPSMAPALALYRSLGFIESVPYYDNPVRGAVYFRRDLDKLTKGLTPP